MEKISGLKGYNKRVVYNDKKIYYLLCWWCDDEDEGIWGKMYELYETEKEARITLNRLSENCFKVKGWIDKVNLVKTGYYERY